MGTKGAAAFLPVKKETTQVKFVCPHQLSALRNWPPGISQLAHEMSLWINLKIIVSGYLNIVAKTSSKIKQVHK